MKQYRFSLKDECMKEELDYSKSNYRKNKSNLKLIPVLKEILSEFVDGKIYNEYEIEFKLLDDRQFCFPKYKVEAIDHLWNELRTWFREIEELKFSDRVKEISEIKKQFTITRNNNQ